MKLSIPRDRLLNPVPPRIFLCNTSRKVLGQLPATAVALNSKWRQYSELSFEIQRTYVDMIDGETKVHPLYDKVEAPRNCLVEGYGLFCLQDIGDVSGDSDTKSVSAFSLEYAASNKYLTNFRINTGDVDSAEVLYNEKEFGLDYSTDRDSFYKYASGDFNAYESYYKRNYTDKDSYTYEQVQIANENEYAELLAKSNEEYAQLSDKLYIKSFPNVQLYNENRKGLSLLHLIFEYIPEWRIGNVDQSLWHKERQFSHDRISVYDFLMNDVSETFGCTFVWNSLDGTVDVYEEVDDDEMENEASTRWETDVFISKSNLASECQVNYSSDNIKTKLVVTGSDDLDIREVNLGRNEIMDLSFYHTEDWMEQDLFERYDDYLKEVAEAQTGLTSDGLPSKKYPVSYPDAVQGWVTANNKYIDLMHAVPSEDNVLLVGDEFKKLFCVYTPIDTAYADDAIINDITMSTKFIDGPLYYDKQLTVPITNIEDKEIFIVGGFKLQYIEPNNQFQVMENLMATSTDALIKKLNQYHVDEDIEGNKNDNIFLKLKNSASDVATIRIYDDHNAIASEYNPYYNYYSKDDKGKFAKIDIADGVEFDTQKAHFGGNLYTNNYQIQAIVVRASHGTSEDADHYTMSEWINGELTAEKMDLSQYSVTYIGTMGAYFVLAKDEVVVTNAGTLQVSENYLKSCGVNLLKEKHKVYTSIFQTQTEAMFSQEKYQCIVQDEQPEGNYKDGTRWLDTNSSNGQLYEFNSTTQKWIPLTGAGATASEGDKYNYENYQRYLDNYNKLRAVQEELIVKEREAEYCLNGIAVSDMSIDYSLYKEDADGNMRYNGQLLEGDMHRAAEAHFGDKYTITRNSMDQKWPLYKFTTSFDPITYSKNTKPYSSVEQYYIRPDPNKQIYNPIVVDSSEDFKKYDGSTNDKTLYIMSSGHIFAVYLNGSTPHVAYANSQGVYQMIRDDIRNKTEMSEFFKDGDLWLRLSPFIKEDEFNDSNFLLTGYESEEERISICEELMEAAAKELKALCKPSLEFSMTMANILALPEFEPLIEYFQLGNFIKVEIREGYVKRTRLLEVNLNFDDLSDFSCTFGNLVTTKSEIDKHAELLSQAVTAGKQVAKSSNSWQKSVDKANKLESDINNGLQDAALKIRNASGQNIEISENGLIGRKLIEGTTNQYEDEQVALINNKLVFTADNWNTSKSCFGKFEFNGEERWGVLSDAVVSGFISGSVIEGGSLRIGGQEGDKGTFIVNSDGSVQILGPEGNAKYATKELEDAYRFQILLEYDGLTVFLNRSDNCTITCKVYDNTVDITDKVLAQTGSEFKWSKSLDSTWTPTYVKDAGGNAIANKIIITHEDVERNAQFACAVTFDETKFTTEGGASE